MNLFAPKSLRRMASRFAFLAVLPVAFAGESHPTLSTHEFFYVGGKYVGAPGKEVMTGQMYVERLRPEKVTQRYPMVFFHGGSETATNWMSTPDGRTGWADYFLKQGFIVYLIDQPARGRSAWLASVNGPAAMRMSVDDFEKSLNIETYGKWPQAKKHTQWPGEGDARYRRGDPIFDNFYASLVPQLNSMVEIQTLVQAAGTALLDKIGPAIIVVHSQSGGFGWLLADKRPKLVKGILAVEPNGPPFQQAVLSEEMARAWGLTEIPLTYSPPAKTPADLGATRESAPDGPDLVTCWKQADPPRTLPNLQGVPILILSSEASAHAAYDQCTAKYLTRAGVENTYMRLEDQGIHGNFHHMMLEKNNLEISALIYKWMTQHIK